MTTCVNSNDTWVNKGQGFCYQIQPLTGSLPLLQKTVGGGLPVTTHCIMAVLPRPTFKSLGDITNDGWAEIIRFNIKVNKNKYNTNYLDTNYVIISVNDGRMKNT